MQLKIEHPVSTRSINAFLLGILLLFCCSCKKSKIIEDKNHTRYPNGYAIIVSIPFVNNDALQIKYPQLIGKIFNPLPATITDAEKILAILLREGFNRENIIKIGFKPNESVRVEDIYNAFEKLASELKPQPNDLFVFYYSGHGYQIPNQIEDIEDEKDDQKDEVLVVSDGFIIDDTLAVIYNHYFYKTRNVMIVDACHAGSTYAKSFSNKTVQRVHREMMYCNISSTTNIDESVNMIYFGAAIDKNESFGRFNESDFTKALYNLYQRPHNSWKRTKMRNLACNISSEVIILRSPNVIQYAELGQLSEEFKNDYLFKIK